MHPMAGSRTQVRRGRRGEKQMTMEEGNGVEAGGSTPTGACAHPSAVKAKPIEGPVPYCGPSRREHDREGQAMSNQQGLIWRRLPLGSSSVGAPHIVPWFVLSIKSEKERTGTMLYVLHSHCCFDFGPARALGWLAGYCGIRPRTRHWDDKLRGCHGTDTSTSATSICRSP